MRPIYCDYNSTTPTDPRVADAVKETSLEAYANASSGHRLGQAARARLQDARARIAALIGAKPAEIIVTASGSEADNLAIIGSLQAPNARGKHLVTVGTEHHAVTETAEWAERAGFQVTRLPVDRYGRIDPDDFSGGFALWSGTSFAAPYVAARLAQALVDPLLTADRTIEDCTRALGRARDDLLDELAGQVLASG